MDNQLPADVLDEIKNKAQQLYLEIDERAQEVNSYEYGLPPFDDGQEPIIKMLTEYASKLHQVEQERSEERRQYNDKIHLAKQIMTEAEDYVKGITAFIGELEKGNNLLCLIKTFLDGK